MAQALGIVADERIDSEHPTEFPPTWVLFTFDRAADEVRSGANHGAENEEDASSAEASSAVISGWGSSL